MNIFERLFLSEKEIKRMWRAEACSKGGRNHIPNHEPKRHIVENWQKNNPNNYNMADCIRDTGLSKPTVYKYFSHTPPVVSSADES